MKKILVLGCGRIGSLIAKELAKDYQVMVADSKFESLFKAASPGSGMDARLVDLSNKYKLQMTIKSYDPDIVVGALPSVFGLQTLQTIIECGKNYVDISFMPEDPRGLERSAMLAGVTVVIDMGVMPGLGNLMAGHAADKIADCDTIKIFVGGNPENPIPPYFYKAPFAPNDVIEEYTRPARLKKDWCLKTLPAMTGSEMVWTKRCKLEAFNTDGLRTLLSLPVPNMVEKTLRHPGHRDEMIKVLEDPDFDRDELFEAWKYNEGEADRTTMMVHAHGPNTPHQEWMKWTLDDEMNSETGDSSMARTTAFPCVTVARMILEETIVTPGLLTPEYLALDHYDEIISRLRAMGLHIEHRWCRTTV